MNKSVLVTGISGSGKSAVCNELKKQGYTAYDIEGMHALFKMVNKKTGKVVDDKYDNQNLEHIKRHDWICNKKKLRELISKNANKKVLNNVVFYCGAAANTNELLPFFDKVILLRASLKTTRKRLNARKSDGFGRTKKVQNWVFEWKEWWENLIVEKDAIVIDANRSLKEVANKIVKESLI